MNIPKFRLFLAICLFVFQSCFAMYDGGIGSSQNSETAIDANANPDGESSKIISYPKIDVDIWKKTSKHGSYVPVQDPPTGPQYGYYCTFYPPKYQPIDLNNLPQIAPDWFMPIPGEQTQVEEKDCVGTPNPNPTVFNLYAKWNGQGYNEVYTKHRPVNGISCVTPAPGKFIRLSSSDLFEPNGKFIHDELVYYQSRWKEVKKYWEFEKLLEKLPIEERKFIKNGKTPNENFYPLSKSQLERGLNQATMARLYDKANESWTPEIEQKMRESAESLFIDIGKEMKKKKMGQFIQNGLPKRQAFLVYFYEDAFGFTNSDSTDLIEILVTATKKEKRELKCDKLFEYRLEIRGNYQEFLKILCNGSPTSDYGFKDDEARIESLAANYRTYATTQSNKASVRSALNYSYTQMRQAFYKYSENGRTTFHKDIDRLMKNDTKNNANHFLQVVDAIATEVGLGRPYFFAKLLNQKVTKLLNKDGTKDAHNDLLRILLTRAQIDLPDIVEAYKELFGGANLEHIFQNNARIATKKMGLYKWIVENYGRHNQGFWTVPR